MARKSSLEPEYTSSSAYTVIRKWANDANAICIKKDSHAKAVNSELACQMENTFAQIVNATRSLIRQMPSTYSLWVKLVKENDRRQFMLDVNLRIAARSLKNPNSDTYSDLTIPALVRVFELLYGCYTATL